MPKAFKYISLVIILTVFFSTSAQNIQDSLYKLNYEQLEKVYQENNFDDIEKAQLATKIFISKAKKELDSSKIAKGFYLYHFTVPEEENSIKYLDSSISYSQTRKTNEYPALAYFSKAQFYLYHERNITLAVNNVNRARKYADNNIDLSHRIDYLIGIVKSEHLNEKQEALLLYKKCERYYKNKSEAKYRSRYLSTLHAIAETYLGLKKYDSATYYNKLGYLESSKKDNGNFERNKAYFVLCEGINKHINQEYNAAKDSIHNALPTILENNDISNTIDSYYYLGKSYYNLEEKEKAIVFFKKTDSVLETLNSIPQYKHVKTYEYLKDYYKDVNDLENQNKYLSKLNTILGKYLNDQIIISKKVKQDYDIPKLQEEQQSLIKKLNKNTSNYIFGLSILSVFILILSILLYRQYRKRKTYQLRFDELMKKSHSEETDIRNKIDPITKTEETKELQVPEKHVKYILEKLKIFEEEKGFLAIGVTSQSLADDIDTNVKYLSRVINHYKNKTFTNYINELRINHAVKELRENEMLRKFTIKAIANEFGYSRAETFSNVFYKQVKIKPSYYIKQLTKSEL
ncbi:AraC family transcriptional regulator [Aquimarina sp. D1M17]|uniref:helix-turn-helix domain-containing protein n=1 Tax=Aquimarina acroporae TaxID=2937283 RepID=UPI0020C0BE3A|nr:helix-turn-helix domain-containing protein [Aquimarina acroporae]MCK8524423.1 AraC family transcriptional regulator [Aquimarina acroporae]